MRLRLYHHRDGARVAYWETGTGQAIVLLHSLGLSHREWAPIVGALSSRFRVVLPDLPLHGDSEDRPRHPYTPEWLTEVIAGFCAEVGGPRASVVGHDLGAELALRTIVAGDYSPARLVLMGNRLHRPAPFGGRRALWRVVTGMGTLPVFDVALSHAAPVVFRPRFGERLSAQRNPESRDVVRHAFADVGGNTNRARAWAKFSRRWPFEAQRNLLDAYPSLDLPVLLLWADEDPAAPLAWAQEALDLIPGSQLRTIPGAGFLVAYDDPVALARELISFCG
ncbi:MAG TPA: alpha/beta hydrolase [Solirubrobacteraceae bacterium]|jgi:pimeloyl-ACP methyl ester carboxylesterase|nr:alpha/beta hydrolase [Solirubrobacteraceae bacterium]